VMVGYHNRDDENKAVFTEDGGFRTGDLGLIDDDGFLYITGRIKEQYKLENGKYVVPTPLEEALKLSPFVHNAMVYGDNRLYNVALIAANVDAIHDWAKKENVSLPGDVEALLKDPKVRELYKSELSRLSKDFKGYEEIRDFALIPQDFTPDNGMLTPSLKVKRRKIMEVYGPLVEAMYGKDKGARSSSSAQAAQ